MELIQKMVTENPCYRSANKIEVKGLMLHSVGCPQPSAEVFVKRFNSADSKVCVHGFIDAGTGKVYQTLPWDYRAWHCGGSANRTHVGVEMCEPSCISYTGGSTIKCSDEQKAQEAVRRTLQSATELFAELCKQYRLNPLEDGVIISHKEGHDRGLASGHGDPNHLFTQLHMNYTMDDFRRAVAAAMNGQEAHNPPLEGQNEAAAPNADSAGMGAKAAEKRAAVSVGDIVSVDAGAVYFTGKQMPTWVKETHWVIKSIGGDRAVLGKSEDGSTEINSPVAAQYLKIVKAVGTDKPQGISGAQPTDQAQNIERTAGQMNVSDTGVSLVAKYEGCRLEAYKCPAGVWTIGYGHTAGVKEGDKLLNQEQAKALLKEDLKKYGGSVNDCVKKGLIAFPVNQNQFDALTSFCYNCGAGNLQKLVRGRSAEQVAEAMLAYNKGGGKVLAGLVKRREEERKIFLS